MGPILRRAHGPGSPFRRRRILGALLAALSATSAYAQGWSFRPVFTVGVGYDSNITFTPGDLSPGDYFGGAGFRAPLSGRLSRNTSLSASYSANCEWYQDFKGFDACPSRHTASLGLSHAPGENTTLSIGAAFSESRRPEDVFPVSGIDFLRGKTQNLGASANLGHRLGRRTSLGVGYTYSRPLYEPLEGLERRAEGHSANASLTRELGRESSVFLRYTYQLYLREDASNDSSHAVGLGFSRALGRGTTLSLAGEALFVGGDVQVQPQGTISLGHAWRSSRVSLSYSRSRNYVLTTQGFTETDSIGASYSIGLRRFQLGASAGYSRNRLEGEGDPVDLGRRFGTYRGSLDAAYMLARWLGAGATYQYSWQDASTQALDERRRHIAQVGFVIAPWSNRKAEGLR